MLQHIAIERIYGDDRNVRAVKATPEQDASLLASMRAIGLLSPIHVTPIDDHLFRVVAGNRRFAAAVALGWRELPCLMVQPSTDLTLIQTTENLVRADMHPLDVWLAVERMVTTGMTVPAVALALNMTEKRVNHLVAMSGMHPKIVASIRKQPDDMPEERYVRTICQASHEKQASAFAEHGHTWWRLAAALTAKGMPRSAVRFDIASYTGEIHRDLFAENTDEMLLDFDQALRLQEQWLQGEREFRISQGFKAAVLQRDRWGTVKPPAGAKRDGWERKSANAKIKKADRGSWIYAACVDGDGAVVEWLYPVAPTQQAKAAAAEATAEVAAPVTKKGEAMIEQAQRDALAGWISEHAQTDMVMLAAAMCILERENRVLDPQVLFAEDGSLRCDVSTSTIHAILATAVAAQLAHSGTSSKVSMPVVHRLGALNGVLPTFEATTDNLAMLKRPGLEAVLARLGKRLADFTSQGRARDFIQKALAGDAGGVTATDLPALAWDPTMPLPYSWTGAGRLHNRPDDDEDLADDADLEDEAA